MFYHAITRAPALASYAAILCFICPLLGGCNVAKEAASTIEHTVSNMVQEDPEARKARNHQEALGEARSYRNSEAADAADQAIAIYSRLAEEDNHDAIRALAKAYSKGGWYQHEPTKAVYWWKKAGWIGDSDAMIRLADAYLRGYGTKQNVKKATYWLNKAITRSPFKQDDIAKMLLKHPAQSAGQLGLDYLEQAVRSGNHRVADRYFTHYIQHIHQREALVRLDGILEQDQRALTSHYLAMAERWRKLDAAEACVKWLQRAARTDSVDAMKLLARYYDQGICVDQNHARALKWQLKAASLGDASAQYETGLMYAKGIGTSVNEEKALYWLVQSGKVNRFEAEALIAKEQGSTATP